MQRKQAPASGFTLDGDVGVRVQAPTAMEPRRGGTLPRSGDPQPRAG